MKRVFTFSALVLMTMSVFALDVNIYASKLRASETTSDNKVDISYILNAPAVALQVQFISEEGEIVVSLPITESELLTKGEHTTTVDLSDVPGGNWKWALKAQGAPNPAPDGEEDDPILEQVNSKSDTRYIFYNPQGIAIDRSFESDYFGRMYVTESMDGDTDGMTETSKTQKRGVFVYNELLDFAYEQNNEGFLGGVDFHNGRQGIRRPALDADGYLFVTDNNTAEPANSTGVWMMDPSDPTKPFVEVLDTKKRGEIYTKSSAIAVEGTGADRVLYVLDYMEAIVKFPIGDLSVAPYSAAPDTVIPNSLYAAYNVVNSEVTIKKDGKGGFWLFQNRGQLDIYPMCAHITKKGDLDFYIAQGNNDGLAPSTGNRGSGSVSADGKYMAFGGGKSVNLYEVTWSGSKVSEVKKVIDYEFPNIGTNIDAIEFDVANNVFVASASSELIHIFALPTIENTFTTPAPSRYMIESKNQTGVENIVPGKLLKKGVYDLTGKYLGETADNLPAGMYIVNGKKLVK